MIKARWDRIIPFESFVDHDRETLGETKSEKTYLDDKVESTKYSIKYWMENYKKNRDRKYEEGRYSRCGKKI